MRFKRGVDGGTGVLQTAVVSYRKKFPWSLLRPFLQVTLKFVSFSFCLNWVSVFLIELLIISCYILWFFDVMVVVSVNVVG